MTNVPFDREMTLTILECARVALRAKDMRDEIANRLDLDDETLMHILTSLNIYMMGDNLKYILDVSPIRPQGAQP